MEEIVVPEELVEQVRESLSGREWTVDEKLWVDDNCVKRYLRARKLDVKKAAELLESTLDFRLEWDVEGIMKSPEYLKDLQESAAGCGVYLTPFHDTHGHPIIVMHAGRKSSTGKSDYKVDVQHVIYHLERCCQQMDRDQQKFPGVEKWFLFFDFKEHSMRKSAPLKTAKTILSIFQSHYPERLYKAMFYLPPMAFSMFYGLLKPFLDPVTAAKVTFARGKKEEDIQAAITENGEIQMDMLQEEHHGTATWSFEKEQNAYWELDATWRRTPEQQLEHQSEKGLDDSGSKQ